MEAYNYVGSLRLKRYDYSHEGAYFITICLKPVLPLFGRIWNQKMYLSSIGTIAYYEWRRTFDMRANISLDEFIIMPDHFHAIVWLGKPQEDFIHNPFQDIRENPAFKESFGSHNSILAKTIQAFKASVTRNVRREFDPHFRWQRGYYERILRDKEELVKVRQYIRNNPLKWDADK